MSNKSFLGLFESSTKSAAINLTTMSTSSSTTTTSTTTPIPIIIKESSDISDTIVEEIETVEGFLLIIVIQLTLVILYKLIKMCRKGYRMHNEKVIRIHESTNPRL